MSDALPKEGIGDEVHRGVRAVLSAIPIAGGAAVELFNRLLAPPIQRRRDAWLNDLADRVSKLEQEGRVKLDDLCNNDEFISSVLQASLIAVRNHQQEKFEALRNAVLNTALGQSPDDARREIFLRFIGELTVNHLQLLAFLANPEQWFVRHNKPIPSFGITPSLHGVIKDAMPDLLKQDDFLELLVSDLSQRKLFSGSGIHTMMSAEAWKAKRTTDLGDEFIRFISDYEKVGQK